MSKNKSAEKIIRYSLGILLLIVAVNAFGGGYYGMAGAKDVPIEWLKGSPFRNYFVSLLSKLRQRHRFRPMQMDYLQ